MRTVWKPSGWISALHQMRGSSDWSVSLEDKSCSWLRGSVTVSFQSLYRRFSIGVNERSIKEKKGNPNRWFHRFTRKERNSVGKTAPWIIWCSRQACEWVSKLFSDPARSASITDSSYYKSWSINIDHPALSLSLLIWKQPIMPVNLALQSRCFSLIEVTEQFIFLFHSLHASNRIPVSAHSDVSPNLCENSYWSKLSIEILCSQIFWLKVKLYPRRR